MAEKEYIERGALLENLKKQYGEELGWQCTVNMSDVGMMIEDAPASDVVEVVRCKDCTYSHFVRSCSKYMCEKGCGTLKYCNDFCSYGKRNRN